MKKLTEYDPSDVSFEELRFREGLRTAVATGDHPHTDAVVVRNFGADVVEPTVLKDGEELIDADAPSPDMFNKFEERLERDGIYAVMEGTIDGHIYKIRLTARDDFIETEDKQESRALRVR